MSKAIELAREAGMIVVEAGVAGVTEAFEKFYTLARADLEAENAKLKDLLREVSRNYTRDDDLPDELLPRIDEALGETK